MHCERLRDIFVFIFVRTTADTERVIEAHFLGLTTSVLLIFFAIKICDLDGDFQGQVKILYR